MWIHCLKEYDDLKGIAWRGQILDSQIVSAPVERGKKQGKTRQIEESLEPKGTISSIRMVFLWLWYSREQMSMTAKSMTTFGIRSSFRD